MREQQTLGNMEYKSKKRKTWRELFLDQMEAVVLWKPLPCALSGIASQDGNAVGKLVNNKFQALFYCFRAAGKIDD
jgi:hypothetical protein